MSKDDQKNPFNDSTEVIKVIYELRADVKWIKQSVDKQNGKLAELDEKVDELEQTNAVLKSALGPNFEKLAPAVTTAEKIDNILSDKKLIYGAFCLFVFLMTGSAGGFASFLELIKLFFV